ncbi:MAG: T9SS type A sorting domain-containing protein [Bacteroidetes bacterium]|nr:T9SS type A sorting domain-containing protein [Bacteroidota bacterium]
MENAEILITDLTGKMVHQTKLTRSTYLWETGIIENGVYLVLIKSNSMLFEAQKVIINR